MLVNLELLLEVLERMIQRGILVLQRIIQQMHGAPVMLM
jgi:hypothetical protein